MLNLSDGNDTIPSLSNPQEIEINFHSLEEWQAWLAENPEIFRKEFWTEPTATILSEGFIEPLTGIQIFPHQIEAPVDQFREGIVYSGVNSRLRAVMRLIETHHDIQRRQSLKIYAPEAVTTFAIRLKSIFPGFVGSEFTSDPAIRESMFPILFQDLTALSFADQSFDLVATNDVFEHVPDIDSALHEIARVLKPDGWHFSTYPFHFFSAESEVRARLVDGNIEHLKPPEYHGNPFDPAGSLVFEMPGWDMLERCRKAGFSYAAMRYCKSVKYGYLAEHIGGIFVLCCRR